MKKEKLIQNPQSGRPHVVLLGAGASRAAFPEGDASGKKIPVMNDLVDILDLKSSLKNADIELTGNFESIYSSLKNNILKKEIEGKVFDYFNSLSLPASVTIYDRLLLSLRRKDAVFTFNWDPFLFDAYQRNRDVAPLPHIYFLHGNVRIGACETCDNWGRKSAKCPNCNTMYAEVPLLYPIEKKNYFSSNNYTAMSWRSARCWFAEAFTITFFGYSAPESDSEAVELVKKAWLKTSDREAEPVEVIDILDSETINKRWKKFTPTLHLQIQSSFAQSFLGRYPRRSCEALYYPMTQGIPCEDFPLSSTDNLDQLQKEVQEIVQYEGKEQ